MYGRSTGGISTLPSSLLVGFEQAEDGAGERDAGAVEGVDVFGLARVVAEPDVRAARLERLEVVETPPDLHPALDALAPST